MTIILSQIVLILDWMYNVQMYHPQM